MFRFIYHSQGTRGINIKLCPQPRTTLYKFSIHCFGPKCWNALPDDMKTVANLNLFKKQTQTIFVYFAKSSCYRITRNYSKFELLKYVG